MTDFTQIIDKLYMLPAILIGFSLHEFAHAYAAYLMGDRTAMEQGRLTIDPRAHIDILGFLTLMFAGFGWAKPVPIDPNNFKTRSLGTVLVSIAGPLTNIIIAFISILLLYFAERFYWESEMFIRFVWEIYRINLVLCVFNLLPIPPLDGSKILASFLPGHLEYKLYRLEGYSNIILLILLLTGAIGWILGPIIEPVNVMLNIAANFIVQLFGLF